MCVHVDHVHLHDFTTALQCTMFMCACDHVHLHAFITALQWTMFMCVHVDRVHPFIDQ